MKKEIPAHLVGDLEKAALDGAKRICRTGCTAPRSACHRPHTPYDVPAFNPDFKCPLALLDIPESSDTRKWYEIPYDESIWGLEDDVFFAICAVCPHSKFTYDETAGEMQIERVKFETHCLDCPVYSCLEVIDEARAEAECS